MTSAVFRVDDMTCGHCVSTITKALMALDREAQVDIDLGSRRVEVRSSKAEATALQQAIKGAGYSAVGEQPAPGPATAPEAKRGGCGCGCG